jgi:hypothetical protein
MVVRRLPQLLQDGPLEIATVVRKSATLGTGDRVPFLVATTPHFFVICDFPHEMTPAEL